MSQVPEQLNSPQLTKRDVMIAVWEELDCESVGAIELEAIQLELGRRFRQGGSTSPAAIARVLADEGAVLRHPEIVSCDVKWRRKMIASQSAFNLDFESIDAAAASLALMRELRQEFLEEDEPGKLKLLEDAALNYRNDCSLRAASKILEPAERLAANEIASWLDIWMRTPDIFADWLALRRASPEFQAHFDSARLGRR